ncbi:MAG: monovalent cation/H+ antiporter complex subunit F [Luteibaculaceae bacterium]
MTVQEYLYLVIFPILILSVILVFIRFLRGPSIADRVVALDLIITIGIGIIAIYTIQNNRGTFLDIALMMTLIAFLGTAAFSYYLEKRQRRDD